MLFSSFTIVGFIFITYPPTRRVKLISFEPRYVAASLYNTALRMFKTNYLYTKQYHQSYILEWVSPLYLYIYILSFVVLFIILFKLLKIEYYRLVKSRVEQTISDTHAYLKFCNTFKQTFRLFLDALRNCPILIFLFLKLQARQEGI